MAEKEKTPDPLIGRRIGGKFEILSLLGAGSMGRVYRAQHTALDKVIAVKVLNEGAGRDATVAARFKSEARAASRLDHPNSVQIFDFGDEGGLFYIAMELLEGKNLGDVVRGEKKLSLDRSAGILSQTLAALGAAHRSGVVHRDLKPANIMLVKRHNDEGDVTDFVKVCDFGIAKVLHVEGGAEATALALTRDGAVFGTPAFMSPEQARGEKVDARTDLFSCGIIFYKMITGSIPFRATTAPEMLAKLITAEPDPIARHLPAIDPRIEAWMQKALAKDRSQRFQTAQEMRSALKDATSTAPAPAPQLHDTIAAIATNDGERTVAMSGPPPQRTPSTADATLAAPVRATNLQLGTRPISIAPAARRPEPAKRSPWRAIVIAVSLLVIAAAIAVRFRRDPVSRLAELIGQRSYGLAEGFFLEHFDALADRPEATRLAKEALRQRRETEGYDQRTGIGFDPAYRLVPSVWHGDAISTQARSSSPFTLSLEQVDDAVFSGHLEWPSREMRTAIHGIHEGNHLVFWEYAFDPAFKRPAEYILEEKVSVLISGDRLISTETIFAQTWEAKRAAE